MSSPQNCCEVWIDTTELREKKREKRKRQTRPISKLLNPLARCGGYSVAVALNFTQTVHAMPATKQSTISSFFSPQRKDAEKKPTLPPEPCMNASDTIPIKSAERQSVTDFGCQTSMKTSDTIFERDISEMTSSRDVGGPSVHLCEKDHLVYSGNWKKEQTFLHLIRGCESDEEVEEPEGKRRLSELGSIPESAGKQTPVQCLPIPETLSLSQWEHNTQDSRCLKTLHQRNVPVREDSVFSVSQMSERDFRAQMALAEHTSTQRKVCSPLRSPAKNTGKENCPSSTARWQDLGRSRSPLKRRPLSPSSAAAKSRPLETKCSSPRRSVLKVAKKEFETDSMASLFTQDSQGFRVIAHRNHQSWSPLKDWTNNSSRGGGLKGSTDEDTDQDLEAEMLFTQDSQGNLVIKH
ncbi:uncharacterized protein aunip [Alosa pseudoharengus]|uniref:uncharacterized protein aunip n=1 Tax=Alosa pseudoharengus TaxID=34774 RepID=UPI003F8A21FA